MFNPVSPMCFRLLLIPACIVASGCQAEPTVNKVPQTPPIAYPIADAGLGEKLYPNEPIYADKIAAEIEKSIRKQYTAGNAKRDAHPKAHGCVKAEFHVLASVPNQLAKGMFVPDKTYPAWIRFSNGDADATRADIKGDARGMAIKILDVAGNKLLEDENQASTQDFIMINHPVFFANEPKSYLKIITDINGNLLQKAMIPFALGLKGTKIALQTTSSKIPNPMQTRYFSMVPYQLGTGADRLAVKYSARSCSNATDPIPKDPEHNYLRSALKNTLQKGDACMEFLVQPRTSNDMSIEDSMTEWQESKAPFYKVATIRIPKQEFDTPEQNKFCENLSFSPWHALAEHKPLGVTNRMRKVIYDHISRLRHEMNSAARQEPK
ncbi:MAG: catalase family protein [Candidatus Saccharibacteria bacterium]|nr:catalase family protein [Moraxellaceae bacterium]